MGTFLEGYAKISYEHDIWHNDDFNHKVALNLARPEVICDHHSNHGKGAMSVLLKSMHNISQIM